ncbi:MAG: aminopeptidase P family protein [Pseudomonadota bacterium]
MVRKAAFRKLRHKFEKYGLDGILVSNLDNVRYLSGFTGSEGVILISRNGSYFLTGSRYTTQASEQTKGFIVREYDRREKEISDLLSRLNIGTLGFEPQYVTFESYGKLSERPQATKLIPIDEGLDDLRVVKEESEIRLIKEAIRIASESYLDVMESIKVGVEEREIALEIEHLMRRKGAEKVSFDTIVASGKRAALPHGVATTKTIKKGEFIVVDYGARYEGYYSDETQTVVVGKPTSKQKQIYQIVKEAQEKAFEAIRPGIHVTKLDAAARDHVDGAGFGKYFGHGTGHGVGLAIHELPHISPLGKGIIEEGMVFTVEPGIYIPKWGGVRIEDMVRVTSDGYEKLTFLPKELRVV